MLASPRALTIARVDAIEIAVNWRWLPVLLLGTTLLAHAVLPVRFPTWQPSTIWLTAAGAVLAGEVALLLHELSHALVARGRGQEVRRIIFHGFMAETLVGDGRAQPADAVAIALAGPAANLLLAGVFATVRLLLQLDSPLDVLLLLLVLGNAGMALMSLLPIGPSDGARALSGLRRMRTGTSEISRQGADG
jgi:Zn-dependent protease